MRIISAVIITCATILMVKADVLLVQNSDNIENIDKTKEDSYLDSGNIYLDIDEDTCLRAFDPFERINRKIFYFNLILDYLILRPISNAYNKAAPQDMKNAVESLVGNSVVPFTFINSILQLNFKNSIVSLWQFIVNTILGVGGLHNIAAEFDLQAQPLDFSSTLARYGIKSGPYIILPIFGGMNFRDVSNIAFAQLSPLQYFFDKIHAEKLINMNIFFNKKFATGIKIIDKIHQRAKLFGNAEFIMKNSIDPYSIYRNDSYKKSYYFQKCRANINLLKR
ncbi:vacJ like lipofamily protein [Orientia chuto str. Dubai]|uniref:VacJ like lipofamily protein n=2 Tax=Candidatus Orientia mediorientalis TaxID=911112 RepID=A0A0F3MQK5_9RICK|nr:vacJ like lipofamily protein [Orientia chuto str. Dubai]